MITFTIILKIIITAIFGYATLNSFFKFHFAIDRISLLAILVFLIIMVSYIDTEKVFEFLLTSSVAFIVYLITLYIFYKKRNFGYFLLNTYKKEYNEMKTNIYNFSEELNITSADICYNKNKPFLLVIKNTEYKKVNKLVKKLEKIHMHQKKVFTMYHYWFMVIFLILITILWRF